MIKFNLNRNGILSEKELAALSELNIRTNFEKLGEGHTRTAYKGLQIEITPFSVNVEPVVIYIPKPATDEESVCVTINRAKGDQNSREATSIKKMGYIPNIPGLVYSGEPSGRRINALYSRAGKDLESFVKEDNINNPKIIDNIINLSLLTLGYMHSRGYLHRDINPSNIIIYPDYIDQQVPGSESLTLIDHQNTDKIENLNGSVLSTRGGTAYSHRSLLNNLATGKPARATQKTDLFSLGGTFYYMLTGKVPSDYKFIKDKNGREIDVNGRKIKIKLVRMAEDGTILERLDGINDIKEERRLKKIIEDVPKQYREFIYKCMTDSKEGFADVFEAESYFDILTKSYYKRIKDAFSRNKLEFRKNLGKTLGKLAAVACITVPLSVGINYIEKSNANIKIDKRAKEIRKYAESISNLTTERRAYLIRGYINKPTNGEETK